MTNRKRQLGRRTWAFEKIGITSKVSDYFCRQLGVFAGKKPGIVTEADRRFAGSIVFSKMLPYIKRQPLSSAADVVEIHGIGAHAGKFRTSECLRRSPLCLRDYCSDCLSSQPSRSKSQRAEKPVIQLRPISSIHQFLHSGRINWRRTARKEADDIFSGFGDKPALCGGLFNGGDKRAHAGNFISCGA